MLSQLNRKYNFFPCHLPVENVKCLLFEKFSCREECLNLLTFWRSTIWIFFIYISFSFRFFSCPNKCNFLKSSVNVIDYIATISFYTDLFLQQYVSHIKNADIFEFFSIIRILRLFKLTRHSSGLKILLQTFRASAKGRSHLILFASETSELERVTPVQKWWEL